MDTKEKSRVRIKVQGRTEAQKIKDATLNIKTVNEEIENNH